MPQASAGQRQTLSMSAGLKVGIVGATGAVGEEIVKVSIHASAYKDRYNTKMK